jgi:hypothetical protein
MSRFSRLSLHNTEILSLFQPAVQYLLSGNNFRPTSRRAGSPEIIDSNRGGISLKMSSYTQSELHGSSIPLTSSSRKTIIPNAGSDSDDNNFEQQPSGRPFSLANKQTKGWVGILLQGGLGHWLFGTATGWQGYIGLLVIWMAGCGVGMTIVTMITLQSKLHVQANWKHTNNSQKPVFTNFPIRLQQHCWSFFLRISYYGGLLV